MKEFAIRLKRFRDSLGLSQKDFAQKVGAEQSNVSHWENGRNKPDGDMILAFKKTFPTLNVEWLFEGKGEMLISYNVIDAYKQLKGLSEEEVKTHPVYLSLLHEHVELLKEINRLMKK